VPLLAPLYGLAPEAGYTPLGLHPVTQKQKISNCSQAFCSTR